MTKPLGISAPTRIHVVCTNPDCTGSEGRPWTSRRKARNALDEPCPCCLSAVMEGSHQPPPSAAKESRPQHIPFMGVPKVTVDDVRFGQGAHQRLEQLARRPEHRARTRAQLVGWVLDQWGAGLSP